MDFDFWNKCWERPSQPFHLAKPHHFLTKYFNEAFAQEARVFLPLCGKTQDLNFLAKQGIKAVGVEFNQQAVKSFFADSKFTPTVTEHTHKQCYEVDNIELWLADFFAVGVESLGMFDRVFDRAALVALPRELRATYVAHLKQFMTPGCRLFVVTMDYNEDEMDGPPFFVNEAELKRLFPQSNIIKHDRFSILETHPRWRELELSRLDEVLYEIQIN